MKFRDKALRELYESDSPRGLPPELVPRIRRILADLDAAVQPNDLSIPGYRLHPLSGEWDGLWSVRVSANSRIVFRFEDGEPTDVDLIDYHEEMTDVNAMAKPTQPGESIRFECIEVGGMTVTEAARLLGCSRPTLSRVLNGRAGISPEMAIAFERQGWSNADFWVRRQAAFDLAQARRRLAA